MNSSVDIPLSPLRELRIARLHRDGLMMPGGGKVLSRSVDQRAAPAPSRLPNGERRGLPLPDIPILTERAADKKPRLRVSGSGRQSEGRPVTDKMVSQTMKSATSQIRRDSSPAVPRRDGSSIVGTVCSTCRRWAPRVVGKAGDRVLRISASLNRYLVRFLANPRLFASVAACGLATLTLYSAMVSIRSERAMRAEHAHLRNVNETLQLLDQSDGPIVIKNAVVSVASKTRSRPYDPGGDDLERVAADTDVPLEPPSGVGSYTSTRDTGTPESVPVPAHSPIAAPRAPESAGANEHRSAAGLPSQSLEPVDNLGRPPQPAPPGKGTDLPRPPIGPYLDGPPDENESPSSMRLRSGSTQDPLRSAFIQAEFLAAGTPWRVLQIREQQFGLSALVSAKDYTAAWVQPGHMFPNGWTLVDVTPTAAAFLSPGGRVVRVASGRPQRGP